MTFHDFISLHGEINMSYQQILLKVQSTILALDVVIIVFDLIYNKSNESLIFKSV